MPSSTGRSNVKAAYCDLHKPSSLNQSEETSNVVTRTDKELLAAQNLSEASHHLKNTTTELKACVLALDDRNASQSKCDNIARTLLHEENDLFTSYYAYYYITLRSRVRAWRGCT